MQITKKRAHCYTVPIKEITFAYQTGETIQS